MELRPYQRQAVEFALDVPRCNMWIDMGMGKTLATLYTVAGRKLLGIDGPVLVLAPKRVATVTWPDEVAKWNLDLSISTISGSPGQRVAALRRKADIYTVGYENIPWLVEQGFPFETVVADEATRLRSFRLSRGGKRASAMLKVAHNKVKYWINLTGTPAPKGLIDLWGQQWFVDRGEALGKTYSSFLNRWFTKDYTGFNWKPHKHSELQIMERMKSTTLSLRASDWFDITLPIAVVVPVKIPNRDQYRTMEKHLYAEIADQTVLSFSAVAALNKCRQLASGFIYTEDGKTLESHEQKLEALDSIIEETNGRNLIVAYNFTAERDRLLKRYKYARLIDDQSIKDWNAGKIKMLLLHPASAGHGLNLQYGGNIMVFISPDWNLELHDQAVARIGPTRQAQAGKTEPVRVFYIVAQDTVDEDIMCALKDKTDVQESIRRRLRK